MCIKHVSDCQDIYYQSSSLMQRCDDLILNTAGTAYKVVIACNSDALATVYRHNQGAAP